MPDKLENKVAVITGAGSGIGKAMAVLFAKEGASLVVADVVEESLDKVVEEIKELNGKVVSCITDVAVKSDVESMIKTATDKYGRLDILCNNAGIMDRMMPVTELSDEFWERVIDVNLNGPFWACRKAIPVMIEQGKGVILNTASMAGLFGCRAGAAYTSSKHALVGLTKNIAFMYADKGIRCNAICPGGVVTNIGVGGDVSEEGMARMELGISIMPSMGNPEELATVALMLVSDDGSFMNGVAIPVDGGWAAY